METVKKTAKSEIKGVKALSNQAVRSRAWSYPLHGIFYFATHRKLWSPLTSKIIPLATLSAGVIVSMFMLTYIPQSIVLTFVNGQLAWITTIALVLSESAVIIVATAKSLFIDEALVEVFDGVLLAEQQTELLEHGREVKSNGGAKRLGKAIMRPFKAWTPQSLISYLIWLPLNFIPVIGTIMFIFVQGRKQGPTFHARYFQLKGIRGHQKDKFVNERRPSYLAFGTVAMLLQLIPGLSILFMYTNIVGAALWVVDVEKSERGQVKKA